MPIESSRNLDPAPGVQPGPCPRCGSRLEQRYKYCPNCSYRLRPEIVPQAPEPVAGPRLGQRLVALGGYLAFASLLLLVLYAGFELFAVPEAPQRTEAKKIYTRDAHCLQLTPASFRRVERGNAFWGAYAPGEDLRGGPAEETIAEYRASAERFRAALETLLDPEAAPEELEVARHAVRDAIAGHGDLDEAFAAWSTARTAPLPIDPEAGIPDAYYVDDPFELCIHEVSNDQYYEFLLGWARKSGLRVPNYLVPGHWTRRTGSPDVHRIYDQHEGDLPVRNIPFDAAIEFCGWFWEEKLGADPDVVVDLPTWQEWILAARGEHLDHNFPWGRHAYQVSGVNVQSPAPWRVTRKEATIGGFRDLVGNVAELVYYSEERNSLPVVAGWSHEHGPILEKTVFGRDGFRTVEQAPDLRDVGFRPVLRRAPALPSFVRVEAGKVRHLPPPGGLLPPERPLSSVRQDPVRFPQDTGVVARPFEIATAEITNYQYLRFLAYLAERGEDLYPFVPRGWDRANRLERLVHEKLVPRVYLGYYLGSDQLNVLYPPGYENHPVQGVTAEQAEAYATWLSGRVRRPCTLPTAAQFLRAARGDADTPYPWGADPTNVELVSLDRPDFEPRPFALGPRLVAGPERIVGLAGNLPELVRDEQTDRLLLAGGFYLLPASLCTLDSFLDATWREVQYEALARDEEGQVLLEDGKPVKETSASIRLAYYTGFRVVRQTF